MAEKDKNDVPQDNFISQGLAAWHKAVPSPLLRALIYGGAAYGASNMLWGPIVDTIKTLGRPLRSFAGMSAAEWEQALEETRNDSDLRYKIPLVIGGITAVAPLLMNYRPTYEMDQLWSDHPTPKVYNGNNYGFARSEDRTQTKNGSLYEYDGYVSNIDFSQSINTPSALSLFSNDPFLAKQDYTRNLGTSILVDANNKTPGNYSTLGNIFDSAADKIDTKLSLGGIASTGVKAVVSNGIAKLFTTAVGTMVNLDDSTKRNLIDAGTWAGTISAILE
jgi:hypothetical protein